MATIYYPGDDRGAVLRLLHQDPTQRIVVLASPEEIKEHWKGWPVPATITVKAVNLDATFQGSIGPIDKVVSHATDAGELMKLRAFVESENKAARADQPLESVNRAPELLSDAGCLLFGVHHINQMSKALGIGDKSLRDWLTGRNKNFSMSHPVWAEITEMLTDAAQAAPPRHHGRIMGVLAEIDRARRS